MTRKSLSGLDLLVAEADRTLRTLAGVTSAARPNPADPPYTVATGSAAENAPSGLTADERRHAAGLMRVNHAGEIAAQALYRGQALTARNPAIREQLRAAAAEEGDHLAWCASRLHELESRPSLLNPLWYAGSLAIGALAGALGDRVSLGFVAETERQVEGHLADHLASLPPADERSRRILQEMRADEMRHGSAAEAAGGVELPEPVARLMRLTSKVMTRTSYWL